MKQKCQCPERASEREEGKRGGAGRGGFKIIIISSPGGWRHGMQDGNGVYRCNIVE